MIPKNNEQKARSLDDTSRPASVVARELAPKLGLSASLCGTYLSVKRAGYDNYKEYVASLAQRQGFNSKKEKSKFKEAQAKFGSDYTLEKFREDFELREDNGLHEIFYEALEKYLRQDLIALNNIRNKMPKNEQRVHKLDNKKRSVKDSAKIISRKTGLTYNTCIMYIGNHRQGISNAVYRDFRARQVGFMSPTEELTFQEEKLKDKDMTIWDFRDKKARQNKFQSVSAYLKFQEDRRLYFQKDECGEVDLPQKKFEYRDIEIIHPKDIDLMSVPISGLNFKDEDRAALWQFIEKQLTPMQYRVIYARYEDGKSLREVGKDQDISGEMARLIESKALDILKHPSRIKLLEKII